MYKRPISTKPPKSSQIVNEHLEVEDEFGIHSPTRYENAAMQMAKSLTNPKL